MDPTRVKGSIGSDMSPNIVRENPTVIMSEPFTVDHVITDYGDVANPGPLTVTVHEVTQRIPIRSSMS